MRRNVSWMILVLLFVGYIILQGVGTGTAPSTPIVAVDPSEVRDLDPSESFTINVTVANITAENSLYGWNFNMSFNPNILNVTSVQKGPFLGTAGVTTPLLVNINNAAGWVMAGELFMPPNPEVGAVGSGVLANVTFQVKSVGMTPLHFASTKLNTVVGTTLVPIAHDAEDGLFDNRVGENQPPVAIFNAEPLVESPGKEVIFDASASYDPDGAIVNYTWNLGDSTPNVTETDPVVYHHYTEGGNYTVTLTVADYDGATDIATADVVVNYDVAVTSLTKSHAAVTSGTLVTINATVANEGNFTSSFAVTARYSNLTNAEGVSINTLDVTNLAPYAEKTLTFTWNTTDVPLGNYVISANASVVEGEIEIDDNFFIDGTVIVGEINIMDHQVVVGGVTFHVITESNSTISNFSFIQADKKISFNVAGEDGSSGFCNVTIPKALLDALLDQWIVLVDDAPVTPPELLVTENATHTFIYVTYSHSSPTVQIIGQTVATPPIAVFTHSPEILIVDKEIAFNSTSFDPDGNIASWEWDLNGDDIIDATTESTAYTYTATGTYTVTLTVRDNEGLWNSTEATLTVVDYPNAVFTYSPETPVFGETITLDASASNATDGWIVSYAWDFGDGNVTTVSNLTKVVTHTFAAAETYKVTLNVTDNNGLNNTGTQFITIGKTSSTVSIALSQASITLGENTTISGSIDPVRSGVTVTIWYRLSEEETWSTIATSTTDESQYSHVWTPESTGTYEIKALWDGDENTLADETEVRELTVQEAPPPPSPGPDIPLYLIAAVVAAVVVITIIVGYFIRARKPA